METVFKINSKLKVYVECFHIPKKNRELVSKLLTDINEHTPEEKIKQAFEGVCSVRTKSDFKKVRRKNLYTTLGIYFALAILLVAYYFYRSTK